MTRAPHGPEHEALVDRALAGEIPRGDRRLRSLVDSCATCAEELRALAELGTELDTAGDALRRDVDRAIADAGREEEELVLEAWRTRIAPAPAPAAGRWPRRAAVAVAAAVILVVAFLLGRDGGTGGDPPLLLGPGGLEIEAPRGEGADFSRVHWRCPRARPGWRYVVQVLDENDAILAESPVLRATEWAPAHRDVAQWPNTILVRVTLLDASGEPLGDATERASR